MSFVYVAAGRASGGGGAKRCVGIPMFSGIVSVDSTMISVGMVRLIVPSFVSRSFFLVLAILSTVYLGFQ